MSPARFSSFGHGEYRADAHLVGLAARDGETAEHAERREIAARGLLRAHHHAGSRAVGELAGIASGNGAARLRRTDFRNAFISGVGAQTLVALHHHVARRNAAVITDNRHRGGCRDDLVPEVARGVGGTGADLAAHAVLVHALARDVVALAHDLGRLEHG